MTDRTERAGEHPFRLTTLPNGLRMIIAPQPELRSAHVGVYVRTGSRFETPPTNGLSHFLEHMIYRGTPTLRSAHEVNLAFESLGGYLYAATQVDFGVFSVTMPKASLKATVDLFGDVLTRPIFSDIDIEKEIVCEEILEDLDEEGRQVDADNLVKNLVYPNHPLGFTITGDEARVRSFTQAMLREHHSRFYTAANSVVVFSGAVEMDATVEIAARAFGDLPRGERQPATTPPHTQKKPRLRLVDNVSSQTELRVCLRAVGEHSQHRAAMDMLMRILDDGMSTRVYHRVCDNKGLCYNVSAAFDEYEDDGVLDFAAGCKHARTSVVAREMLDVMVELARTGPSEGELAKAQRRNAWELDATFDSPEDLGGFYAGGLLFDHFQTPEERLAENVRVTPREIQQLCAMLTQPERLNVVAVGLLDDEGKRLEDLVKGFSPGL